MTRRQRRNLMEGFDDRTIESFPTCGVGSSEIKFKRKNTFSTKNNPICGITFSRWCSILSGSGHHIEWLYYPRAAFVTLLSMFNSILCLFEHFIYWDKINEVTLPDNPVFIIGHPRTGTTLLHNILSEDDRNFFFCSTFCAGFPSSFLFFEGIGKFLFSRVIDRTRPMDTMPLHFDLPQEDECATNILSGGLSYYMPLWFMKQEKKFRKYLDFDPVDGGSAAEEHKWCEAFSYLLKKLVLRQKFARQRAGGTSHEGIPRLLLKSPIHTARIPLLRRMFPNAKFVYIHRHPDEIFCSAVHMADTAYWYCYLNTPSDKQVLDFIFWQFENMWIKYDKAVNDNMWSDNCARYETAITGRDKRKKNITSWQKMKLENVCERKVTDDILELSYDELTSAMLPALDKVYAFLRIVPSTNMKSKLFSLDKDLKKYTKNIHIPLGVQLKKELRERWAPYYSAFNYK